MRRIFFNKIYVTVIWLPMIIGICTVSNPTTSFAQSSGAAQGIQLSPSMIELNAQKGGSYTLTVEVTNVTAGDLNYRVMINDFAAKDESGVPKILYSSNLPSQISVRTWISSVPSFQLHSRAAKKVTFKVLVPKDAEPGGHYGVLDFSGADTQIKSTGVGLTASAGTLLLVKVAGDIKERALIDSFYSASSGRAANFFESSPVEFVTRIKNFGNIHFRPFGSIELKDTFGSVVANLPVNETRSNVLPVSVRRFENKYSGYMFGRYTATITIGYGTKGEALMASTTFWVIPYRLIGLCVLILIFTAFIFRRVQIAYNRRVIKKFQNQQQENESKKTDV